MPCAPNDSSIRASAERIAHPDPTQIWRRRIHTQDLGPDMSLYASYLDEIETRKIQGHVLDNLILDII